MYILYMVTLVLLVLLVVSDNQYSLILHNSAYIKYIVEHCSGLKLLFVCKVGDS